MPASVVRDLDRLAGARGFANRSQCLTALVRDSVVDHRGAQDDTVMMGLISFIYEHAKRNLQNQITDLQHEFLREIVTIQLVHLEQDLTMQVLLVQGPARTLRAIADAITALKGVQHAKLLLSSHVLPPLHDKA